MMTEQSNITNDLNKPTTNDDKYIELHRLIQFNIEHNKIAQIIEELGTEYLSQLDPNKKDWGKHIPRYRHVYLRAFSEGHALFDLLQEHIKIKLTTIDLLHLIISSVFWRYYHDRSIKNHALNQLKNSSVYPTLTHILYTPEIGILLDCTKTSVQFPYFKRYGETLGYFNAYWLVDPSTYKKECKEIDMIYNYKLIGFIGIWMEDDFISLYESTQKFIDLVRQSEINDESDSDWGLFIEENSYNLPILIFVEKNQIFSLLTNINMRKRFLSCRFTILKKSITDKLQEHYIIPK